jgi:hypothetical protein
MNKLLVIFIAMILLVHNACAEDSLRLTKTYTGPSMSFEVPINAEIELWAPTNSSRSLIDESHHYTITWPVAGSTSEVYDLPDGQQLDIQPVRNQLFMMRNIQWSGHGDIDRMISDATDFIPRIVADLVKPLIEGDTQRTLLSIETNSFKAGIFTGLEFVVTVSGLSESNLTAYNYTLWDGAHCWIATTAGIGIDPDGRQIARDIMATCKLNHNIRHELTE